MFSLIEEGAEKPIRIQNQIGDDHAAQARCEVPAYASPVGRLVGKIGKRSTPGTPWLASGSKQLYGPVQST